MYAFSIYDFETSPEDPLQWRAADAEIKVPSGEKTELKRSPFEAWSRSTALTARDFFLAYFYPFGPFTCIFSKTPLDFSCVGRGEHMVPV